MKQRKFLNKKVNGKTKTIYPEKLTIDEFIFYLQSSTFCIHIRNLKLHDNKEYYMEEWMEYFLSWLNIKQDDKGKEEKK